MCGRWGPHRTPAAHVISLDLRSVHRRPPLTKYAPLASVAISGRNMNSAQSCTSQKYESAYIDLALSQQLVFSKGLVVIYPNKKFWRHGSSREVESFIPGNMQSVSGIESLRTKPPTIQEKLFSLRASSSVLCHQGVMCNRACYQLQINPWHLEQ